MQSSINITISPKFEVEKIVTELINKNFAAAEIACVNAASDTVDYIRNYIYQHSHSEGRTNRLGMSIDFYPETQATGGKLSFFCGIGKISELDANAPYWHIINYGGFTFIAATGQGVGGAFDRIDAPSSSQAGAGNGGQRWEWNSYGLGKGSETFIMYPKSPIEGKHYLEAGIVKLKNELRKNVQEAIALAKK